MRRIKFLGLAGVVLVAALGVLTATASAEPVPTWFVCAKGVKNGEKKYTGKYTTKTCAPEASPTEIAAGKNNKYELKEGVGKAKAFKGKASGFMGFKVKSPQGTFPIACESVKGSATPAMPNLEKNVTLTLGKCEFVGHKCSTVGGKGIEIKGEGELGYVEGSTKVGLEIKNALGEESNIVTFECGTENTVKAELFGAVIGVVEGDVNVVNKESTLTYLAAEQYGKHLFQATEYEPSVNIVGFSPEGEEASACFASVPKSPAEEAAQTKCQEEHPPHVIRGEYCGKFVQGVLGAECTPATYTGLTGFSEKPKIGNVPASPLVIANKGEALEIKA